MKQVKNNIFMILERSNSNLELKKTGEDYILEGIAAVFGEENNNSRIYEEKEYLPHLEYLNKKISKRSLMGELDHPEKFDVSLKNASHIIESLRYDPSSRQIKIKVKLLDTPSGRIAKNLIDNGVPVSISSRAAGLVESNRTVRIKRIFTYDLVADPGFENAQLNRVNESLGFNNMDNIAIIDIAKDSSLYENYIKTLEKEGVSMAENTSNQDMTKYVKASELHQYSKIIRKELLEVKNTLNSIMENSTSDNDVIREKRLNKIEGYIKYLAENLDSNILRSDAIEKDLDKNISYSKYLAENLDKNISYSEYLAENLDRGISYSEHIAENLDRGISYSEHIAENLDRGISYSEHLGDIINSNSDYLKENLDKNISYSEYLGENLDRNISYSEYLAEKLDKGISYSEHIAENLDSKLTNTSLIKESINNKKYKRKNKVLKEQNIENKYDNLSSKVDNLLESVKKQKTEEILTESNHKFFRLLDDSRRKEFLSLNETEKTKVIKALNESVYFTADDIVSIWDNALIEKSNSGTPKFISEMPEKVKPIWESLNQRHKDAIMAQSTGYHLETPYQINYFWDTRNLGTKEPVLEKINENLDTKSSKSQTEKKSSPYSNGYLDMINEALDNNKSRY